MKAKKKYDLLVAYTSGNTQIHRIKSNRLHALADQIAIVSYLATRSAGAFPAKNLNVYKYKGNMDADKWLVSLTQALVSNLSLEVDLSFNTPKGLMPGTHPINLKIFDPSGDLFPIQASIDIKGSSLKEKGIPFWMIVALITLFIELILLAYGYYRTPKCKKCGKPRLRKQRGCLDCMEVGTGVVVFPEKKGAIYREIPTILTIGTQPGCDVKIKGSCNIEESFAIQKHDAAYILIPETKETSIKVNQLKIKGRRLLKSGDQIHLGEWECQFLVKKAA